MIRPICIAIPLLVSTLLTAQATSTPIIGRWDLRVTETDGTISPSWLEVSRSGNSTLVGRYVGVVGSARPISRVSFANGQVRFAIPPQWERDTADLRVEGRLDGDHLAGTMMTPGGQNLTWSGTRAPTLRRTAAPAWGSPISLFNGKDLTGWTPHGGQSRWAVVNGLLTNGGGGGNLITTRTFEDFKLHVEFRYPAGSNSGVYLRGRYEVQIEDSPRDREPEPIDIGAVYGFLPPNEAAAHPAGEWQMFDITLVGRRVTVVLNGRTVIADQVIPGITGGALDSNEGAPGPIYLQGDHGPVEFRRVVLTPAK